MTPIERKARELLDSICAALEDDGSEAAYNACLQRLVTALTPPAGGLPELPELFEALDYATPGPWRWSMNGNIVPEQYGDDSEIAAVYSEHMDDAQVPDNAAAIIAAVNWLRANRNALEAIAASRVGDGWVSVPVEPTDEMRAAHDIYGDTSDWWAAMLAAAPQVALNRGGEES